MSTQFLVILIDIVLECCDPAMSIGQRCARVSGRNCPRQRIDQCLIDTTGISEMVECFFLIEAVHLKRPFDHVALVTERQRAVTMRDRDDPNVKLRGEWTVSLDFRIQRAFSPVACREIKKWK